jgi:hypothetical protein
VRLCLRICEPCRGAQCQVEITSKGWIWDGELDRRDIYLPLWPARRNKAIFGTLFVAWGRVRAGAVVDSLGAHSRRPNAGCEAGLPIFTPEKTRGC